MNLPNKITLSRIFLVPVFMLFMLPFPDLVFDDNYLKLLNFQMLPLKNFILNYGNYIAVIFFIVVAGTDCIDGYIARKRKQVTTFGKFLDPIADKLLITAALISLVQRKEVPAWVAIIIISREFIVTGLRLVAAGEGIVISASKWGKVKTVTQVVAIVAVLTKKLPLTLFADLKFDSLAMLIAVVITIYSGYDYFAKNIKVLKENI